MVTYSINHPFVIIICGFIFLIVCSILAVALGYFKYEKQGYRDLLIWDNPIVINWDKQVVAKEHLMKYGGMSTTKSLRSKANAKWETVLTYENKVDSPHGLSKEFLLAV